jgi:hypothetical protein
MLNYFKSQWLRDAIAFFGDSITFVAYGSCSLVYFELPYGMLLAVYWFNQMREMC